MIWQVEWAEEARRELSRLDHAAQQQILRYLRERIATDQDPKRFGEPLLGNLSGFWRCRVGDYRVISRIEEEKSLFISSVSVIERMSMADGTDRPGSIPRSLFHPR